MLVGLSIFGLVNLTLLDNYIHQLETYKPTNLPTSEPHNPCYNLSMTFNKNFKLTWVNSIIIFCTVIWLGANVLYNFDLSSIRVLEVVEVFGAFSSRYVEQGFLWLFATSIFVHFDILHLAFNMFALIQLAKFTDAYYTKARGFYVFFFGGLIASFATFVTTESALSIGASGGIFALLGLLLGGTLKNERFGSSLPFRKEDFYPTLILAILLPLFIPNINWIAHLGGFLFGLISGFALKNNINRVPERSEEIVDKVLTGLAIGIFVISYSLLIANILFDIA